MATHHADEHPRRNEDEYFARESAELIKQMRARLDEARATADRASHLMRCPRDGNDLAEQRVGDSVLDVCPVCGGMWLDAGEVAIIRKSLEHKPTFIAQDLRTYMDDLLDNFFHHHQPRPQ